MIKQLRVYQLDDDAPSLSEMEAIAENYPARECQHLQQSTIGFREFESMPGCRVLQVEGSRFIFSEMMRFRRSVPKSVLDRETRKRVKARVDRGEEVSRTDKKLIREEVVHEQLPKMPQLETVIPVIFNTQKNQLWIGAGSEGTADIAIELLRRSGLHIGIIPIFQDIDLGRWLTEWMLNQQPLPEPITMGETARINDPHEPKASIAINNEDLSDAELQAVASSRSVVELQLNCEAMSFKLSHDGTFKSIKMEFPNETFDDLAHLAGYTLLEVGNTLETICGAIGAPVSH